MVTSEQFIEKIEHILNYYNLSASLFAEKIGVQRSSLSHLLSGRNKPSLDFVIKIVEEFPDVDLYWFLFNQGTFPKQEMESVKTLENPIFENKKNETTNIGINREILPLDLFSSNADDKQEVVKPASPTSIGINTLESKPETQVQSMIEKNNSSGESSKNSSFENKNSINIKEHNRLISENENINVTNIEINNSIPKIETKHPAKVKKLMLLYEDGFFEEFNYR